MNHFFLLACKQCISDTSPFCAQEWSLRSIIDKAKGSLNIEILRLVFEITLSVIRPSLDHYQNTLSDKVYLCTHVRAKEREKEAVMFVMFRLC